MAKKSTPSIPFTLNEITFHRTSNVFLNNGIVALNDYLTRFKTELSGLTFDLSADNLKINGENLLEGLEWIYYEMGKELYDISQEDGNIKYFFDNHPFKATAFKTMSSYGLAGLITKPPLGPQPVPRRDENAEYFEDIYEKDLEFAMQIANFYYENGLTLKFYEMNIKEGILSLTYKKNQTKGDSRIFLREKYTKTTRILLDPDFFKSGDDVCYLTGECFKKLTDNGSTSPFLAGLTTFNSFLVGNDKKISWKAMYLSRFSPKFCLYRYSSGIETLFGYFFETDNLLNLQKLLQENRSLFMDTPQKIEAKYLSNFKFINFSSKKGDEERTGNSKQYVEPGEVLFMLIFTVYRNLLMSRGLEAGDELEFDIFAETLGQKYIPLSLVSFRADKFASTMRPTSFEQFNQFKFTIRLMAYLEKECGGFFIQNLIHTLLFLERSDRTTTDNYNRQRRLRNTVLSKIMHQKSILTDLETLFFKCYLYFNSSDEKDKAEAYKKDYFILFQLIKIYEPILQNHNMDKEKVKNLQDRAVKLGYSIGMSVLDFESGQKDVNAKNARSYMVHLHKARTAEQFREAIIRFQKKYGIIVSNDILESEDMNDDQSFIFIKQFTVMAALNSLNGALKTKNSNSTTTPTA
jgi:hypothetical protein